MGTTQRRAAVQSPRSQPGCVVRTRKMPMSGSWAGEGAVTRPLGREWGLGWHKTRRLCWAATWKRQLRQGARQDTTGTKTREETKMQSPPSPPAVDVTPSSGYQWSIGEAWEGIDLESWSKVHGSTHN